MAYNLNIDEAKARNWYLDVQQEIRLTKETLDKASQAYSTLPEEQDDIMNGIKNTCEALRDFWNNMCDGFNTTLLNFKSAIDTMVNQTTEIVGDVDVVKNKIGQ